MAVVRGGLGASGLLALVVIASGLLGRDAFAEGAAKKTPARPAVARATKGVTPVGYGAAVRAWHTVTPGAQPQKDIEGRPLLTLYNLNTRERVMLQALGDEGGFRTETLDKAASLLRDTRSGNQHPIEPHLLDIAYRIQRRFDAPELRVLSGYRTARGSRTSNHSRGRAMDFVVPGANNEEVARFARDLGFVGVGIYPTSGFVHVDVRERSYFWVDTSGPGRRNRERGILGDVAKRSDSSASARGEHSVGAFFVGADVDEALRRIGALPVAPSNDDDDEDGDSEADGAD